MRVVCPHCHSPIEPHELGTDTHFTCPSCGSSLQVDLGSTARWKSCQFGKFVLLAEIGRGAFGTVYKARDTELDRVVAVKVPRAGNLPESQDVERFLREARSAAQLSHASIVAIHEIGQRDGVPYLVSEFVEGVTLADLLTSRRMSQREAAELTAGISHALHYAHQCGVVHRDIKPSNIMLKQIGMVSGGTVSGESSLAGTAHNSSLAAHYSIKILDFGLAKRDAGEITMTLDGQVLGTPAYMSPEQARGEGHEVDGRSDVYSLGAVLYQLLTGELPFRGNQRMLLHQVMHDDPRPPRSLDDRVPRDLQTICMKCLQKEPARRYATAQDLADDLERYLSGQPILARPASTTERLLMWARRKPALAALVVISTAAALLIIGGLTFFTSRLDQRNKDLAGALHRVEEEGDAKDEALRRAEEEGKAKEKARQLARDEADAKDRALREIQERLANSNVLLAVAAWQRNDAGLAREHLSKVPRELRRFEWYYLNRRFEGGIYTLRGHDGAVTSVAYSPDGTQVATVSEDGVARLWNAPTGTLHLELKGDKGPIRSVAFSPDGTQLASAGDDGRSRLWDTRSGVILHEFAGHSGAVRSIAFNPTGTLLATGSDDKTSRICNAHTGELLTEFKDFRNGVQSVFFTPDGQRLVTANLQELLMWDIASGVLSLNVPSGPVAISPDGSRIAVAWGAKITFFDTRASQHSPFQPATGDYRIDALAFSPDGAQIAAACNDAVVRLWDVHSGLSLLQLTGHEGGVKCVAFSPDGMFLMTGGADRTARLWDLRSGAPLLEFKGHQTCAGSVAFSPDGTRLATAGFDPTARLWDTGTGRPLFELRGHDGTKSVAFNHDGTRLATVGSDKTARIWNSATAAQLRKLEGHNDWVSSAAFSQDGRSVATGSWDKTARLWNVDTGEFVREFKGHTGPIDRVALSSDGTRLATASRDKTCRIWDIDNASTLLELKGHSREVMSVSFGPDDNIIATGSWDGTARLWNSRTGELQFELKAHKGGISSVAFSPDGSRLATASGDKSIKLWDTHTGAPVLELVGHTASVNAVAFSPDGTRLASAAGLIAPAEIRLWDARPIGQWDNPDFAELDMRRWATRFSLEWHAKQQRLAWINNSWFATIFCINQELPHEPDSQLHSQLLSLRRAIVAQWVRQLPSDPVPLAAEARMLVDMGKLGDYRQTCANLAALDKDLKDATQTRTLAATCILASGAVEDFDPLLAAFKKSMSEKLPDDMRVWGGLLLRAGQLEQARETLEALRKERDEMPYEDLLLALTYEKLGESIKARDCWSRAFAVLERGKFDSAVQSFATGFAGPLHVVGAAQSWLGSDWNEYGPQWLTWIEMRALLREASELIAGVTKQRIEWADKHIFYTAFSPDGKLVLTVGDTGTLRIWDAAKATLLRELPISFGVFLPDGRHILGLKGDKTFYLFDVTTGKEARQWKVDAEVVSLAISPDGKRVVSSHADKVLRIWDLDTGKDLFKLEGHTELATVTYSRDGKHILSASSGDKTVRLWDAETGKRINTFKDFDRAEPLPNNDLILQAFFVGDREVAACVWGKEKTLRVWEISSGKLVRQLDLGDDHHKDLDISPDGTRLLTVHEDRTVRVRDLKTGDEIWRGSMDDVNVPRSPHFSPDGKNIVVGSHRRWIYLWKFTK